MATATSKTPFRIKEMFFIKKFLGSGGQKSALLGPIYIIDSNILATAALVVWSEGAKLAGLTDNPNTRYFYRIDISIAALRVKML